MYAMKISRKKIFQKYWWSVRKTHVKQNNFGSYIIVGQNNGNHVSRNANIRKFSF